MRQAWRHRTGSGRPRLRVFSQARWSGNDGGENCLQGARPGHTQRMRCPGWAAGAHANTASTSGVTCRGSATAHHSSTSGFPAGRTMRGISTRDRRYRPLPPRRTAHAAGRNGFAAAAVDTCNTCAAHGKFSRNARLPPRGVLPPFDVAMSRTLPGRFGRSPYFATGASSRRSLRPCAGTHRMNSLYQCSVTVGAVPDRTCLWAPSLPVRISVRATRCFSSYGVSN